MRAGLSPSLISEYYPTSSSSLEQHTHLRILWLPLSVCFLWSGETLHAKSGAASAATQAATTTAGLAASLSSAVSPSVSYRCSPVPSNPSTGFGYLSRNRHSDAFTGSDGTVSGYEAALRCCLALQPPVPASELSWSSFPTSSSIFASTSMSGETSGRGKGGSLVDLSATLPFSLTSDLGTSPWENVDSHRATMAVVVVVNAAVLTVAVEHAVEIVSIIFAAQFKDKVCRCVVVDPPEELAEKLSRSPLYMCVSESVPVSQTVRRLLACVAQAVVDAQGAALRLFSEPERADSTVLRTPMDKLTTFTAARNASTLIASRFKKKAADILLQVGAVTAAVAVYGETQFNSNADCLWCSATLEGIAAARYRYLQTTLLCHRDALNATVVQLQSDNPTWGPGLAASVNQLGSCVAQYGESLKQTILSFKSASVPNSMRTRLTREVEENVAAQVTLLKGLLLRVHVCLNAGTWGVPSDPQSYRLGSDVKRCVESVLRLAFNEIDVYLSESLRQLRRCAPASALMSFPASTVANTSQLSGGGTSVAALNSSLVMLRKRELEAHFKRLELLAAREARQPFLEELSMLRSLFHTTYGVEWAERSLLFFAYLCMTNGAERRARALLVEFASIKARLQCLEEAAEVLLRVCRLAGVGLPLVRLQASSISSAGDGAAEGTGKPADLLYQLSRTAAVTPAATLVEDSDTIEVAASASGSLSTPLIIFSSVEEQAPDRGVVRLKQCITNAALLNVPLLLELIDIFDRMAPAAATAALRCQLATLLLFKFPHLLDRPTQQMLKSVMCEASALLEPHMSMTIVPPPFFLAWEAFPLPPHLAPKTVPVGGALFTFIDTQRLKLTVLCLNGRKLASRTVWTVGDVASVLVTLYNPFQEHLVFNALALRCVSCACLFAVDDDAAAAGESAVLEPSSRKLKSPISYALTNVEVPPLAKRKVLLQVQPTEEGTLIIDGVTLRLAGARSSQSITGQLPAPMHIPVLQRLPQVSCTLNTSEVEVFGSQRIDFTVRVVNCGRVPITCISLTAHGEQCQLDGCEGCKERRNETDTTVTLNKRALEAAARTPLQPGDVVMIPGFLEAPPTISKFGAHYVLFRTDISLPHPAPEKPRHVPDAVPVYAVIPRRVTETRLRLFHSPGLVVTSVTLTKDRRAVEVRIANRSRLYSMELQLSALTFADLPVAFIVAGAEYVVPPIKLTRIPPAKDQDGLRFLVPWVVRELPQCSGTLELNLSLIGTEVASAEPLDECVVALEVYVPQTVLPPQPAEARSFSSLPDETERCADAVVLQRETLGDGGVLIYCWESDGDSFYGGTETSPVVSRLNAACRGARLGSATGSVTATTVYDRFEQSQAAAERHITYTREGQAPKQLSDSTTTSSARVCRRTGSMEWAAQTSFSAGQGSRRARLALPSTSGFESGTFSAGSDGNSVPIIIPAVTPIRLCLRVAAPRWRRAILLHVHISIDSHFDVAVLTGAVKADAIVGLEGRKVYESEFELFAFKTGEHLVHITLTDDAEREVTHTIHLIVEHPRLS
ncbi:hypothetical protein LSCM1_01027 [Leishmania martiniquensis]|uniref:Uncharacterized protein n=1 Tax=Leishmania martiniquensis TaxID=1580590 RepID=A0A836KDI6_9TRYP|nr:hypothetical protein LSCM1_01027 [Leishmania martiniquensis]